MPLWLQRQHFLCGLPSFKEGRPLARCQCGRKKKLFEAEIHDPPRARAAFSTIECVIHHWHNLERQLNYGRDSNVVIADRTNGRQTDRAAMRTQSSTNDRARKPRSPNPFFVSAHNEVITEKQKKKREADLRKEDPEELLIFDSTPTSSSSSSLS